MNVYRYKCNYYLMLFLLQFILFRESKVKANIMVPGSVLYILIQIPRLSVFYSVGALYTGEGQQGVPVCVKLSPTYLLGC